MKIFLQDTLQQVADLTMHAEAQLSGGNKPDAGLPDQLSKLNVRLTAVLELVDHIPAGTLSGWTDAHRLFFGEWLRQHYPNEASAGTIALGEAWMDGLRVGASLGLVNNDAAVIHPAIKLTGISDAIALDKDERGTRTSCDESAVQSGAPREGNVGALVAKLREFGGRTSIHPHAGTWVLEAADMLERLAVDSSDVLPNAETRAVLRLCVVELCGWMHDHGQDLRSQEAVKRARTILATPAPSAGNR